MHAMKGIVETVRTHLLEACRIQLPSRILVGLSGGADSLALLVMMSDLARELGISVGAAHLNHRLRGEESDRDETFVRTLCAEKGIPLHVGYPPAGALAPDSSDLEARARRVRMHFLETTRVREGYDYLALGHHRDDQAETLLLALLRGAGSSGLSGMAPRRGRIIRPLLGVSREDLEEFLGDRGVEYVTDSSNLLAEQTRNRIRLELIPWLAREYNPGIVSVLARTAELVGEEDRYMQAQAGSVFRSAAVLEGFGTGESSGRRVMLPVSLFDTQAPLLRRVLRLAYRAVRGTLEDLTREHVEMLLRPGALPSGWSIDLPGAVRARISKDFLVFEKTRPRRQSRSSPAILPVPGVLVFPGTALHLQARLLDSVASRAVASALVGPHPPLLVRHAFIDYNKVALPLRVRFWRPGDRMQPLGMRGHRKIQDILVDAKVPRTARSRVPLVLDSDHRVLWLAGLRVSEYGKLEGDTRQVLHLRVFKSRGSGHLHAPTYF